MGDQGDPGFVPSSRASLPVPNPTKSFWQTSHPNAIVNERTSTELPSDADVVVIGSGITAAFAVNELLQLSEALTVVVLEARTTCSGATGRNGGHCQPIIHEAKPDIIDFELKNFRHIEQLVSENDIPCDWRRLEGCMGFWNRTYFEESKEELEEQRRTDPRHLKLVKVVEDSEELVDLRLKKAAGAIVQTTAATLSPYKLIIWMWSDMLKKYRYLNLQTTTPVTNIETTDAVYICHTPRGTVKSKQVLLAVNGYTSHLLPQFEQLIRPVQGQMSALTPPASFSGQLLAKSYGFLGTGRKDRVMSDYLHQRPIRSNGHLVDSGGQLMFGGARECVANHGECVSDDSYADPDAENYLRHLPEILDLGDAHHDIATNSKLDLVASWTGIMGYSKDHFPWVGGLPHQEGLWLCGGYTGHGMTNASGCGQHIARLVSAAIENNNWRDLESQAVTNRQIPKEYVLTEDRLARQLLHQRE